MLDWFQKKTFLADYLEGFVDIHNHILPGIDDGAQNLEESLTLISEFANLGVQRFIATPHIFPALYPNTPDTIDAAHQQLMDGLMDRGLTRVSVDAAAEHMIDASFEDLLSTGDYMPIKGRYLLVEMSFLQPSLNFDEAIIEIANRGLIPILAHPERYMYLHHNTGKYREFKNKGILFQVNLLSLGEYYGKDVHRMARKLLEQDMVDFVATDAHGLKHLKALREIQLKEKEADQLLPVIRNSIENFY